MTEPLTTDQRIERAENTISNQNAAIQRSIHEHYHHTSDHIRTVQFWLAFSLFINCLTLAGVGVFVLFVVSQV